MASLRMPKPEYVKYPPRFLNGKRAVMDVEGRVIWKVRVSQGEMTCLDCGETTHTALCNRCAAEALTDDEEGAVGDGSEVGRNLVPTLSYLRETDYELI